MTVVGSPDFVRGTLSVEARINRAIAGYAGAHLDYSRARRRIDSGGLVVGVKW